MRAVPSTMPRLGRLLVELWRGERPEPKVGDRQGKRLRCTAEVEL